LYQKYFSKRYGAVYKRLQNRALTEALLPEFLIPYENVEPFCAFLARFNSTFFLP